ncbi:MAG: SRPBCC family protein [Dehalococcoidia bacterium]
MAIVRKEIDIDAAPDHVWAAVRDFGAVHERVAPGFLTGLQMDGDARIVTFANGMVAREVLIGIDDDDRRIAYRIADERMAHHSASVRIVANANGGSRFVWITDVLPHEAAEVVGAMMEQGAQAAKRTLERQPARPA